MSGQHTPEPWEWWIEDGTDPDWVECTVGADVKRNRPGAKPRAWQPIADKVVGEANSERIVACVNHCAGFGTDTIAAGPSMAELVSEYGQAAALRAECARLREALAACELALDTAAQHGLPQQLPPAYRESWAAAHTAARDALAIAPKP
jgi:hypothetical protein